MSTTSIKKSTSLRIDRELYICVEARAKKENRSVNNCIETLLARALHFNMPNKETVEAMEELERDRATLKRYRGAKELFEDLED